MPVELFTVIGYPNPFKETFNLNITSSRDSKVNFSVYDMLGRLIEQREVNIGDVNKMQLGNNYPTGIYNIIVNQDDNTQIQRMIKQ